MNIDEIINLDKNINLIFRNYDQKDPEPTIKKLQYFCKIHKKKLFISNNLRLALKYNLDGLYIPAFNKNLNLKNLSIPKKFEIIGSAHSFKEIKIKEMQRVNVIFLSSLFKDNKNYLGLNKFKLLSKFTKKKIVALGGMNNQNIKKLLLYFYRV